MSDARTLRRSRVVYSINVEDIQKSAEELIGRDLKSDEIRLVENTLGDYINWFDAISRAIDDVGIESELEEEVD